ncbi:MAG: PilZ domain-containing protein [Candidatus Omnitrophica bacterium]|nr:PilZ domain-containing protein [Candidatus Omnitrophota bacterium]
MQNKRDSSRFQEPIALRHRAQDAETVEVSEVKNISAGGLRITTANRLDIGSKLNMEVNVPKSLRPYYAQGEVVWLKEAEDSRDKKFDMGVKFLRIISKNDLEVI